MPQPESEALDTFDGLENDDAFMGREVEDDTQAPGDKDETSESDTQSEKPKQSEKTEEKGTPEPKKSDEDDKGEEGDSKDTVDKPEPVVPLHRFKEVVKENRKLRSGGTPSSKRSDSELSEEDKKDLEADEFIEKKVEKVLSKREQRQSEQDTQDAEELVELMDIYGDFDVDKVLDIKDEFKKVGTSLSNEGALKIFFDRQKNPASSTAEPKPKAPKPKVPQPKSSAPVKDESKTPVVTGRPLRDVIEEAKKEYGLK